MNQATTHGRAAPSLLMIACLAAAASGAENSGLLPNPGFERDLTGWVFRPGDESQVTLVDQGGSRGKVLALHPDGKLLGVETEKLELGGTLRPNQAYEVFADLKNDGLQKGVFAFSMYCFDAAGKSLQQRVFTSLSTNSKPQDWLTKRGEFGPGTANPLPEGTASVCVRFSFYEATGDCQGKVTVDHVVLRPYEPPTPTGWPNEILAHVGDLQIRFESRSFWTLYRIDYKGSRLCKDTFGSHYGSVANFPGVGFLGSGHTENEDEQITDLKLSVDGKPADRPERETRCQELCLEKTSRLRDLVLHTVVTVKDNRIVEDVHLKAEKPTPVNLIYHFMHPWVPTLTEYLAELPDGTRVEGAFTGDKTQKIDKPTRWSAVYDAPTQKGAVTCVLEAPADDNWRTRYWDVPDVYRKHYFTTFLGKTVPADKEFHYRVVIQPFAAPQATWKAEAERVAKECATLGKEQPE